MSGAVGAEGCAVAARQQLDQIFLFVSGQDRLLLPAGSMRYGVLSQGQAAGPSGCTSVPTETWLQQATTKQPKRQPG